MKEEGVGRILTLFPIKGYPKLLEVSMILMTLPTLGLCLPEEDMSPTLSTSIFTQSHFLREAIVWGVL